jgi:hypothetical protein
MTAGRIKRTTGDEVSSAAAAAHTPVYLLGHARAGARSVRGIAHKWQPCCR